MLSSISVISVMSNFVVFLIVYVMVTFSPGLALVLSAVRVTAMIGFSACATVYCASWLMGSPFRVHVIKNVMGLPSWLCVTARLSVISRALPLGGICAPCSTSYSLPL